MGGQDHAKPGLSEPRVAGDFLLSKPELQDYMDTAQGTGSQFVEGCWAAGSVNPLT